MRTRIETEAFGNSSHQAIFMVPSWAVSKETMRDFAIRLSQNFYVVLVNLPGISLDEEWISRARIGVNYDIDALTEQLIDAAPKNAWWIGWSLGGMISTYVAARRSSCVQGLITLSSTPSFLQKDDWGNGLTEDHFDELEVLLKKSTEKALQNFIGLQVQGSSIEDEVTKKLLSSLPKKTQNVSALISALRLMKALDVRRELSILDVPNLHIFGDKDRLAPIYRLDQDLEVNSLHQSIVLPNCAHQPFLENEDDCVSHIEVFIQSNCI